MDYLRGPSGQTNILAVLFVRSFVRSTRARVLTQHNKYLRSGRNGERKLRLAAVVDRKALEEEGAEARAGAAAGGVVAEEALEAGAVKKGFEGGEGRGAGLVWCF